MVTKITLILLSSLFVLLLLYVFLHSYWRDFIVEDAQFFKLSKKISKNLNGYKKFEWTGNRIDTYHLTKERIVFINDTTMLRSYYGFHDSFSFTFPILYNLTFLFEPRIQYYKVYGDTIVEEIDENGEHIHYVFSFFMLKNNILVYPTMYISSGMINGEGIDNKFKLDSAHRHLQDVWIDEIFKIRDSSKKKD